MLEVLTDPRLALYAPVLRLDSREQYPPGSAAMFTDAQGNVLTRRDGTVIARPPLLSLGFLRPRVYANDQPVDLGDRIGHEGRDYLETYRELPTELRDPVIYGRIAKQGTDVWAQYWLFYWYNAGLSRHEGDWECVQLLLAESGEPMLVAYAQHRNVETRSWAEVERPNGRPVIYVAWKTHASLYESRSFVAGPELTGGRGYSLDVCDDKGPLVLPRLEVIPDSGWPLWPGRWGDTRGNPAHPWETTSPPSPGRTLQWTKPTTWATMART